jgi:hypothetical protein
MRITQQLVHSAFARTRKRMQHTYLRLLLPIGRLAVILRGKPVVQLGSLALIGLEWV